MNIKYKDFSANQMFRLIKQKLFENTHLCIMLFIKI